MSTQSRGARTFRGAIVSIDPNSQKPNVLSFQYNPSSLKRSLTPVMAGGEAKDRSLAVRILGAPTQKITVEIEIDGTDGLETADPTTLQMGIHPQLAALELLVYPPSSRVVSNQTMASLGLIEISPVLAPRTLFVWGPRRVLPVKMESYSISEEEFDGSLNPIRATVSLEMRVLTYSDVSAMSPEYNQFLAYQRGLEGAGARNTSGSLGNPSPSGLP